MKKGLLSILAGALLVVGCQNYDDQFSSLESQINALASTVAGLSQVQSDLASLSGTVSSLSSTVASLGSSIDTAVSNGLADITADIAALQAALADVASSDDLAAISAAVAANQADLDELLANSSVYTGPVTINSVSTLDTYYAMGSGLAIVNGSVDIDATADMDNTKLQAVIDAIQVTTGSFDYQAASSSVAAVSFDNLTGTQTLTVKQSGDYSFKSLGSATNVFLYNTWKNGVKKIDFRELTSVTKFYTNSSTANTIDFDKATELHLTKLAFYAPLDLTIVVDEGAAMPFILDDKDIDGDQANITLDITGPAALTISNLTDGSLTFANVAALTVNGFEGSFDINAGVESFTADKVTSAGGSSWLAGATDLETLDITGATDPDVTTDVTGPVVTLTSNSNIETMKVAGKTGAISLNGNSSLTDVTISANVNGAIAIGSTSGNSSLSSVTLTGSKATAVHVENNEDLASLTIDTTFRGASASTTVDGDIDVVNNASLASLTITSTAVENLEVVGNDVLTTVDFSKIATDGTTGTPDVDIYDNDLSGTLVDQTNTASTLTSDGAANDLGKVTTTSGLDTVKTYLTHIDGATSADIKISFDTVNFTTEDDATSEVTFTTDATAAAAYAASTKTWIAYITPNTASTGKAATKSKRSFIFPVNATTIASINVNNTAIVSAVDKSSQGNAYANLLTTAALANADAAGVTMTVTKFAAPIAYIDIRTNDSAVENSYTGAAASALSFGVSDSMTLTIDGLAATITASHVTALGNLTDASTIGAAMVARWNTVHAGNSAGTASASQVRWSLSGPTAAQDDTTGPVTLTITAKDRGSRDIGAAIAITHSQGKTSTDSNIGFLIGNYNNQTKSTSDNVAQGSYVMVTFEADTAGDLLGEIGSPGDGFTSAAAAGVISIDATDAFELSSAYAPNSTLSFAETSTNVYPTNSRLDVIRPEEAVAGATSNAETFNRVHWL